MGRGGGRAALEQRAEPVQADLSRADRRPMARLEAGETGRLAGASAAIDVSDGLASDLRHLGRSSGVGIALDRVPVADGASISEALLGERIMSSSWLRLTRTGWSRPFAWPTFPLPSSSVGVPTGPASSSYAGRPIPLGGWSHRF